MHFPACDRVCACVSASFCLTLLCCARLEDLSFKGFLLATYRYGYRVQSIAEAQAICAWWHQEGSALAKQIIVQFRNKPEGSTEVCLRLSCIL